MPTLNDPKMLYYTPLSQEDVRWNFEKVEKNAVSLLDTNYPISQILFDRRGQPYKRFAPTTEPFEMEEDIRHLIEN